MLETLPQTRTIKSYCGLCAVHCPIEATVDDGRVKAIRPDSTHPFGGAICAKGRAAPEMLEHPDRVNYPLRRTRPKGDADPGWERISWDEALDLVAEKLLEVRASSGPQAVAFAKGTGGGTALTDTEIWINRLVNLFGSPNLVGTTHLCQWPRDTGAAFYTFGTERLVMPDVTRSGCIVLWGSNPNNNFLSLARDVAAAKARGARLLVVDPRKVGLANKADLWLQLRPGTDGALALALIHLLIERGWFDLDFVRDWTNAPLLVRDDSGMLLSASEVAELGASGADGALVAARGDGTLWPYDPRTGTYPCATDGLTIDGAVSVRLRSGAVVTCRPVLQCLTDLTAEFTPATASAITAVPAEQIEAAARLLVENRPVSHYFHNGLVQHTNATQASRAIEVLYALLGDFDRPGGNVPAPGPRVNAVQARSALAPDMDACRLGRAERPLGPPARPGSVAAYDLYESVLEGQPYPVRALVSFGSNMLLANGDTLRGREALRRLEFFAQFELWHTPTSAYADVLLPAASFMEAPALKLGFRYPIEAMAHVQRRDNIVEPLYERRSDVEAIFDLGCRLGLAEHFWNGDVEAGYDHVLEPAGETWKSLGRHEHGLSAPRARLRFQKYAEQDPASGLARGFATPTRKAELYSVHFARQGAPPLPTYREPAWSPLSAPELLRDFPLVLTNAKRAQYLHSQHRGLPSIRKTAPYPTAELHPATAGQYGIADGDWILVETPKGAARARAAVMPGILPGVVCTNHGWWQGCEDLGLPALDPFSELGANINLLVHNDQRDPISGGTPHRSYLCRVRKAG